MLNRAQRLILCGTLLLLAASIFYPPWRYRYYHAETATPVGPVSLGSSGISYDAERPGGYRPIFMPPTTNDATHFEALFGVQPADVDPLDFSVSIDSVRLAWQCMFFYAVGTALAAIHRERLYRETHKTFEDYLRARWALSRSSGYDLIAAAEVVDTLAADSDTGPANLAQALALASVTKEMQAAVFQIAQATAPNGRVSAQHIKSVTSVLTDIIRTGGMDDGTGEMRPVGVLVDANITEETYERLMRQKEHVKAALERRDEAVLAPKGTGQESSAELAKRRLAALKWLIAQLKPLRIVAYKGDADKETTSYRAELSAKQMKRLRELAELPTEEAPAGAGSNK